MHGSSYSNPDGYQGPHFAWINLSIHQLPEHREETPGAFLLLPGLLGVSRTKLTIEAKVRNELSSALTSLTLEKEVIAGNIKVWSAAIEGTEITLPADLPFTGAPIELWVEVQENAEVFLEGRLSAVFPAITVHNFYGVTVTDRVKVSVTKALVVEAEFTAVSNTDFHQLHSDKNETIAPPHWKDTDLDGDGVGIGLGQAQTPLCYTRSGSANVIMRVATLKVRLHHTLDVPTDRTKVKIKAGYDATSFEFGVKVADSIEIFEAIFSNIDCAMPMPSHIEVYDPLPIFWQISLDGGNTWMSAGTTRNQTYVTWKKPELHFGFIYHSAVHVGCVAASGIAGTDPVPVLNAIWNNGFATRSIRRADGRLLSYYGFTIEGGVVHDVNQECSGNIKGMLSGEAPYGDFGHGSCTAWALFMIAVLQAQGIKKVGAEDHHLITARKVGQAGSTWQLCVRNFLKKGSPKPAPESGWIIRQMDAGRTGANAVLLEDLADGEATDIEGAPGQGNSPNPKCNFGSHQFILVNGVYYDPSYGKKYADLAEFVSTGENGALAGIAHTMPDGVKVLRDVATNEVEFHQNW